MLAKPKKLLRNASLMILALVALLAGAANFLAQPAALERPSPHRRIEMPDGSVARLGDLVQREHDAARAASAPLTEDSTVAEDFLRDWYGYDPERPSRVELARALIDDGNYDDALAVALTVERDHADFARAQRLIGWDLFARGVDPPEHGVAFVNRSVLADPFEGNAWQDLYRTYLGTIGL